MQELNKIDELNNLQCLQIKNHKSFQTKNKAENWFEKVQVC